MYACVIDGVTVVYDGSMVLWIHGVARGGCTALMCRCLHIHVVAGVFGGWWLLVVGDLCNTHLYIHTHNILLYI